MDAILIEGLEITCIVGLRPHERVRKQPIVLDLELELDLAPAGRSGRIGHTCDYDRVADSVRSLLAFREYHLIEAATEELAAMLLGLHPALERFSIRLAKPAALLGRARSAAVRIRRDRADFPRRPGNLAGCPIEVLLESREAGLYACTLPPSTPLPAELGGPGLRVTAWVVSGSVATPSGDRGPGATLDLGAPSLVASARNEPTVIFVCTTPPLDPAAP
jgi:dihydroneopterin aldolase